MNILTLNLISGRVHYHFFPSGHFESQWSGCMKNAHGFEDWRMGLAELRQRTKNGGHTTEAIGIRLVYGGSTFRNPWFVTAETEVELQALSAEAPLHIPATIELIRAIRETYCNVPLSFFLKPPFLQTCLSGNVIMRWMQTVLACQICVVTGIMVFFTKLLALWPGIAPINRIFAFQNVAFRSVWRRDRKL